MHRLRLAQGNPKDTKLRLTWLAPCDDLVPVRAVTFDHLITKDKLEEEDKFEDFVNRSTRTEVCALLEEARDAGKGWECAATRSPIRQGKVAYLSSP